VNVGSLFSGIGGFDLGFEAAGMSVAWQSEIDPYANKVLTERWPHVPNLGDVSTIDWKDEHHVDLICGGFPCQDLSVAGRRAGLAGKRSGLWWEFARAVDELRPQWVVIENVPGLLSSRGGRDMGAVLGTLADFGYGFAYRVLDAQFFGLAQRRKRVFVVGCLGDRAGAEQVLLEPEGVRGNPAPRGQAGQDVAGTLTSSAGGGGYPGTDEAIGGHVVPAVAHCLTASERWDGESETFIPLRASQGGGDKPYVLAFSENQRAEVVETPYSHQLTTGGGKPGQGYPAVRVGMAVRRLTPVECERLQGFPDGWTAALSDTRRYRALGNAVAVPVAAWIAKRVAAYEATRTAREAA